MLNSEFSLQPLAFSLFDLPLFAQTQVPWSVTAGWLYGFIGLTVAAGSVLFAINQWKKAFGRRPPVDDELRDLDRKLRQEIREGDRVNAERITSLEDRLTDLQIERERTWRELKKEIGELAVNISFIRGRMERLPSSESH